MPFEMERDKRVAKGDEEPQSFGSRVEINIGHACNNNCRFCMQANSGIDHKRWVPLDKVKNELRFYRQKGIVELGILGGEPTLYPWLMEALAFAKELGYERITINSNGRRFADAEFTRACVENGVNRFCLSVHSQRREVEDYLSGRKGVYDEKMQGIVNIMRLKKAGLVENVSLNPVLTRKNMDHMVQFVSFFKRLGIWDIRFNFVRPEGGAENNPELVPRYSEAMPFIVKAMLANETKLHINLTFGEIPFCTYPAEIFGNATLRNRYIGEFIDSPTNVTEFIDNTEAGRRRFLWQELKSDVLKSPTKACKGCKLFPICGGVWKNYLQMYGEREFGSLGAIMEDE